MTDNLFIFTANKVRQFKTEMLCVGFGGYESHEKNNRILQSSGLTFDFYQFIDKSLPDTIENYIFVYFIVMTSANHARMVRTFKDLVIDYYRVYDKNRCVKMMVKPLE